MNFMKSTQKFEVTYPSQLLVLSSDQFSVWAFNDDKLISHLGPFSGNTRLDCVIPEDTTHVEVRINKGVPWAYVTKSIAHTKEIPDPEPLAVHLQRPLTLKEQITQAIREEMSRAAMDDGYETFEEADDFDINDEDDMQLTQYELSEMQEEYPIDGGQDARTAHSVDTDEQNHLDDGANPSLSENPPPVSTQEASAPASP